MLVGVQLHLSGDPGAVEVRVPPAFLLLRLLELFRRPDERDAEVTLLPIGRQLLLQRREGRGQALLGC